MAEKAGVTRIENLGGAEVAITNTVHKPSSPPCLPTELPNLRLQLIKKWGTPGWRLALNENNARAGRLGLEQRYDIERSVQREVNALIRSDLYWVGPDMCDLLYQTVNKIPDDINPTNITFPSAYGTVVLAEPFTCIDSVTGENNITVDAMVWGPARIPVQKEYAGTVINGQIDVIDMSWYRCLRLEEGLSDRELVMASVFSSDDLMTNNGQISVDARGDIIKNLRGNLWVPVGRSDWPVEQNVADPMICIPDDANVEDIAHLTFYNESVIEDRRFLSAFFTLLATHSVTETSDIPVPHHVRRKQRLRKMEPTSVKIVYLRRPKHDRCDDEEHEPGSVNWSHRWMVSAHIRNQPCGPDRSQRKLIMIPAHVKGPEDLPLVVKDTVKVWVR